MGAVPSRDAMESRKSFVLSRRDAGDPRRPRPETAPRRRSLNPLEEATVNIPWKTCRLDTSLATALLVSTIVVASPAIAQIAKDQQTCINAMEKDFTLIDKQVGRQVASCLKNHAKERALSPLPTVDSMAECLADDPRSKISLASQRAAADFSRRCTPPLPSFGPIDVARLSQAAWFTDQMLAQDLWTDALEPFLAVERIDKPAAGCQQKVWKAVAKCEQAKLKEFARCTRKGLKGASFPGLIDSGSDLRDRCLGVGTAAQPDPKKKVARACTDPKKGIQKVLDRSCSGLSLTALLPTCGSASSSATAACLDRRVSCRACLAINAANGIQRDCELFDDGAANNSCACGNGALNAGEQCDDGNNQSYDGCTFDCRVEIG
jgi:cysteine-rich repeat protein